MLGFFLRLLYGGVDGGASTSSSQANLRETVDPSSQKTEHRTKTLQRPRGFIAYAPRYSLRPRPFGPGHVLPRLFTQNSPFKCEFLKQFVLQNQFDHGMTNCRADSHKIAPSNVNSLSSSSYRTNSTMG